MKLWLISQNVNNDYDTYDSAVVTAETDDEARRIHPNYDEWLDETRKKRPFDPENERSWSTWARPEDVTTTYLGECEFPANLIVCASFNAG